MKGFVSITEDGRFALDGKRWLCNSTVYFGRHPGSCGGDWIDDKYWSLNEPRLDRDFDLMARVGLNHAALFFKDKAFFDNGRTIQKGMDRLDRIVEAAKSAGIRISLFFGPFIDNADAYRRITGREWEDDNRWLPPFNPTLHEAYVQQVAPFARRYRDEPTVMAYTDRIDRFCKGFDNVSIPFNLKEEWGGMAAGAVRVDQELAECGRRRAGGESHRLPRGAAAAGEPVERLLGQSPGVRLHPDAEEDCGRCPGPLRRRHQATGA